MAVCFISERAVPWGTLFFFFLDIIFSFAAFLLLLPAVCLLFLHLSVFLSVFEACEGHVGLHIDACSSIWPSVYTPVLCDRKYKH